MLNVVLETIDQNVLAYLITLETHMNDVEDLNAWQIQTAPPHWHVEMKNALILATVLNTPIVHHEIIEEFVNVNQDTLEILMA